MGLQRFIMLTALSATSSGLPAFSEAIGRLAIRCLHAELTLSPKPGLVCPGDSGSHKDMDASTFYRSLFALRSYFRVITEAGAEYADFETLRKLGVEAEKRMLAATGGVNTHRGAIFNLGLLAAAAGQLTLEREPLLAGRLGERVVAAWGTAIASVAATNNFPSHGFEVARKYGVGGARAEALSGFATVQEVALPVFESTMEQTGDETRALTQTLFALMGQLQDTNLLYRGGRRGLDFAQSEAQAFLRRGGVHRSDWENHARDIHRSFVQQNLSPGGSADLLATTLFVARLQRWGS